MEFDLSNAAKPPFNFHRSNSLLSGELRHLIIIRLFIYLFLIKLLKKFLGQCK